LKNLQARVWGRSSVLAEREAARLLLSWQAAPTRSTKGEKHMPQGSKAKYTDKQKRKAEKIEDGYKARGVSGREAERRAWATVNKQDGGGKRSGSGRRPARRGGR
jgi:hypothetical protein